MPNAGFIKLYRKMVEWGWYKDSATKDVFLHLLFIACYEEKQYRGVKLQKGDVVSTVREIAEQTGLSHKNVRTAIDHLISTNEVSKRSTTKFTVFTINNYQQYQIDGKPNGKQVANERQTSGKPYNTKKLRNKEDISIDISATAYGEFQNVSLNGHEYSELVDRLGNIGASDYIERLSAYIAQSGKRYKSHYATILNWWRRDGKPVKGGSLQEASSADEITASIIAELRK